MASMTPSSRKTRRRAQELASPPELFELSPFDLYDIQGNSDAVLELFSQDVSSSASTSAASEYNCLLLGYLYKSAQKKDAGGEDFLQKMDDLERKIKANSNVGAHWSSSLRQKERRNELILAYNRALVLTTVGRVTQAAHLCVENLQEWVRQKGSPPEELANVSSRMGLLLLECILQLGAGRTTTFVNDFLDSYVIVDWLDKVGNDKNPQLKFLLTLYKTRLNLTDIDETGKHSDNKIRAARKDLKQAMDLLQNKLRPTFGAESAGSIVSSNSEENMSQATLPHEAQPPQGSIVLQRYNQSALSLKAHSEQLKGNIKKSLILCNEAWGATAADSSYEAVHANNLAVVYETDDKRHLALHALSKGLQTKTENVYFHSDGTAQLDQTLLLLHNAALCSLRARRYLSAYECMASCINRSEVFYNRPRCWLRLGEACVGLYAEILQSRDDDTNFSIVDQVGR
jgi:hypothetical protein